MRAILPLPILLVVLSGCSGSVQNAGPGGTSSSSGSGSSSGASSSSGAGSSSSSSSGMPFDAGGTPQTYMTGMGPIVLASGGEETNCITIPLGNTEGGFVRRFTADLSEGSHHMIVYTSQETVASPTPTPCFPFQGITSGEHPIFIAQQPHAQLVFPTADDGTPVGFEIQPNQMVKVEFHTINTTTQTLSITGTASIDTIPLTSNVTQSNIAFWGMTKFLPIQPHMSADTGVQWQQALPATKSFAVTTHQHHLGTEMKVWYSAAQGDTSDLIADSTSWSNPPLVLFNPPLDFPAGGTKGMSYECQWNNTTASVVTFGESATNEMCFLWHYYYPSQGFQLCTDGQCQ